MTAGHPTTLRDIFQTLSKPEREMLVLRWADEMEPDEIEAMLGLEPGTVVPLVTAIRDRATAVINHWD